MYMAQHPTMASLGNPAAGLANRVSQLGARPTGGDPHSGAYKATCYGLDAASLALGGAGAIGKLREILAAEDAAGASGALWGSWGDYPKVNIGGTSLCRHQWDVVRPACCRAHDSQ